MKSHTKKQKLPALLAILALATCTQTLPAAPLGTAFTYQGKLSSGTNAANGIYDFSFKLYDDATAGTQKGAAFATNGVPVTNGLFAVTLDFGNYYDGTARWLDISVKTNGAGGYTTLAPRQPLTPTPYALMAASASNVLGTVPATQLSGTVGNSQLAYNSVTVTAGTGLNGGGAVALGGSTTLNNAGVLSVSGNADITAAPTNGNVTLGSTATDANTASRIVKRDAGGNFSAGSVTLAGNLNLPATTSSSGIIYAGGNPLVHGDGSYNFFAGQGAGNLTMSGNDNTGIGYQVLNKNTSGSDNTAVGALALYYNTNGFSNTAIGNYALFWNSSGAYNTANGCLALYFNTNGNNNTANGFTALRNNTSGSENTANGIGALFSNTSGNDNTANGARALYSNTNGYNNTANGAWALNNNTSGYNNTADGVMSLFNNTNGSYNTALGNWALQNNLSGWYNIAIGYMAGGYLTTGRDNIDIGNRGVAGESQVIRIGTQGTQTNTFIAGIYNNVVSAGTPVYVDSNGQLGAGSSSPVALLGASQTFTGTPTFNPASGAPFTVGNSSLVTNLNADQLDGLNAAAFWQMGGNAGTSPATNFLGTTDNQPLELKVFGKRALRLEPASGASTEVNVIAGSSANSVGASTVGATIGGGTNNVIGIGGSRSIIAGGYKNLIGDYASVSAINGGSNNKILTNSYGSVIGGGDGNQILGNNTWGAIYGVIGGGRNNIVEPYVWDSLIGGGIGNRIQYGGWRSVIPGGIGNRIGTNTSWAAISGGGYNTIEHDAYSSVIGGGESNLINSNAYDSIVAGGSYNAIGLGNFDGGSYGSVISGGISNIIYGVYYTGEIVPPPAAEATIAGGANNTIDTGGSGAAIGGGLGNHAWDTCETISGGQNNNVWGKYGTISGGQSNSVSYSYGTIPGGAQASVTSYGQLAYASGAFANPGDAQASLFVLRNSTTNNATNTLCLSGVPSYNGGSGLHIPNNKTWSFDILLSGRSVGGAASVGWKIQGMVKCNAGTAALIGSPTYTLLASEIPYPTATLTVIPQSGEYAQLLIKVSAGTGANGTFRWVATVRTCEVGD